MDERKKIQIEQEYASCEFCLHDWLRTLCVPTHCPRCGRPYYGN